MLPVFDFAPVSVDYFPDFTETYMLETLKLRNDQSYLYQMCKSVIAGECSPKLLQTPPGAISHARWLTTANRVLRLYVSANEIDFNLDDLETLKQLVHYIVGCYAPVYFDIKNKPSLTDGSRHYFQLVKLSRQLPQVVYLIS